MAHCEADDLYRIEGRLDDVMNINGHRIGAAEVEACVLRDKVYSDSPV